MMHFFTIMLPIIVGLIGLIFAYPTFAKWVEEKKTVKSQKDNGQTRLTKVLESKVLRVGCIQFPPIITIEQSGGKFVAGGLYGHALEQMANEKGISIVYRQIRNDDALKSLLTNKVDVVAALLQTPRRSRHADFAGFLYCMAICGLVKKDNANIASKTDLRKEEVRAAVVEGEVGAEIAEDHYDMSTENGRLLEIDTDNVPAIFTAVMSGDADIAITTSNRIKDLLEKRTREVKNLKAVFMDNPLYVAPCGLMICRDDPQFREWLDAAVRSVSRSEAMFKVEQAILPIYKSVIDKI